MPLSAALVPVPNLDSEGFQADELREVAAVYHALAVYCAHMAAAQEQRQDGSVRLAQRLEHKADRVYDNLPEWAKW